MLINVLGTIYKVERSRCETINLEQKIITVGKDETEYEQFRQVRHGIIKAYKYESGIAKDRLIDVEYWLSVILPKMFNTIYEAEEQLRNCSNEQYDSIETWKKAIRGESEQQAGESE